jgi:D-xylose 1-dehydrogenase (NADP+, D-xylono-1,5-lactone-forming)
MTAPRLRWALLGAARIADFAIAPALQALGQPITVLGCRDAVRGQAFAQRHGIARVAGYAEAIARADVDAVYVALPNALHEPWVLAALAQGKHVLCEKPLALSADAAQRIADAAVRSQRTVMEAFMFAFHPKVDALREHVCAPGFGAPRLMAGSFTAPLDLAHDIRGNAALGGGAMADLGVYALALMRWLSGSEPSVLHARSSWAGVGDAAVDRFTHAVLAFPMDTQAEPLWAHLDCGFTLAYDNRFEVASAVHRLRLAPAFYSRDEAVSLHLDDELKASWPAFDPYQAMLAHFIQAVVDQQPVRVGLAWSCRQAAALEAVLACSRAQPS